MVELTRDMPPATHGEGVPLGIAHIDGTVVLDFGVMIARKVRAVQLSPDSAVALAQILQIKALEAANHLETKLNDGRTESEQPLAESSPNDAAVRPESAESANESN